jgi:vesicle coat complex subunit
MNLSKLFDRMDTIVDPEAKSALIWVLGEYCHLIENANNILQFYVDAFLDETVSVQYYILSAAVKCYLRMPSFCQDTIHALLRTCTDKGESPDLRDKAYVYWRMLSIDPKLSKVMRFGNVWINSPPTLHSRRWFCPKSLDLQFLEKILTIRVL